MADICRDGRFEIIEKAKKALFGSTNISDSPDEMKVIDDFLFRCWQMGWLDKYDKTVKHTSKKECGDCAIWKQMEWIPVERELPKDNKKVMIKDADGDVYIARHINGNWDCLYFSYDYEDVIAWKPIEPYTGDKG